MFEQRTALQRRITKFRDIQVLYMPIVRQKAKDDPTSTLVPQHIETTPLYLPSSLSASDRDIGCNRGLPDAELRLRKAQCHHCLDELRTMIHVRMQILQYKHLEVRHVGPNTRCQQLLKNHEA